MEKTLKEILEEAKKLEESSVKATEESPKDLLNRYTEIEIEIQRNFVEESDFIAKYKEIFEAYYSIQAKTEEFRKEQEEIKAKLKDRMRETNTPEESNDRFIAKYTAPYTKKNFNTKQFYEDYAPDTAMYKKYVGITNVSESIKISEVKKK